MAELGHSMTSAHDDEGGSLFPHAAVPRIVTGWRLAKPAPLGLGVDTFLVDALVFRVLRNGLSCRHRLVAGPNTENLAVVESVRSGLRRRQIAVMIFRTIAGADFIPAPFAPPAAAFPCSISHRFRELVAAGHAAFSVSRNRVSAV